MKDYCLECILNENKIIIDYPYNINSKNIIIIGTLDYEKLFINEYIIVYKDDEKKQTFKNKHLNNIKGALTIFLNGLYFINNTAPFADDQGIEMGIVIKCDQSNNNNNIINDFQPIDNPSDSKTIINNNKTKIPLFKDDIENDEYNLNYKADKPDIKSNFKCCPNIGLQNIGATCYMNATLQCFCHIEEFVNFFKYKKQVIDITRKDKDNNLTSSFKLLIENLWPNNNKISSKNYYAPEEFKKKISKMNPLFKGIAANDAKDLVNFIIMTLHEELNKAQKKELPNDNKFIDQTNKQLIFQNFVMNFQNENKSIISDIFYGVNFTSTQCSKCRIIKYNFQTYFFLIFPLEEVRKMKIEFLINQFEQMYYNIKMMNPFLYQQNFSNFKLNINNMKSVNIIDCFQYYQKMEYFTGDN